MNGDKVFNVLGAIVTVALVTTIVSRPTSAQVIKAMGDAFSMADCAAAPALYYANLVAPLAGAHDTAAAYLDRLMHRPSFVRAVKEAEPYRAMFPK